MGYNKYPQRKSIRLDHRLYKHHAVFSLTICTQDRQPLLGNISDQGFHSNEAGTMLMQEWVKLPEEYSSLNLIAFQVMPDHIHGILELSVTKDRSYSLQDIVKTYKSRTTWIYTQQVKNNSWIPFVKKLWQRGYYEHMIRNENDLNAKIEYIQTNPQRWWMKRGVEVQ